MFSLPARANLHWKWGESITLRANSTNAERDDSGRYKFPSKNGRITRDMIYECCGSVNNTQSHCPNVWCLMHMSWCFPLPDRAKNVERNNSGRDKFPSRKGHIWHVWHDLWMLQLSKNSFINYVTRDAALFRANGSRSLSSHSIFFGLGRVTPFSLTFTHLFLHPRLAAGALSRIVSRPACHAWQVIYECGRTVKIV